jgi:hypothetical protein
MKEQFVSLSLVKRFLKKLMQLFVLSFKMILLSIHLISGEGADFKLKVLKKDGYWNYDSSEFSSSSPLLNGDDDELKEIYDKLYNITEFVNPDNFKSYEDLQTRLDKVLGNVSAVSSRKKIDPELQDELNEEYEQAKSSKSFKPSSNTTDDEDDDEEADALDYFQKLSQM